MPVAQIYAEIERGGSGRVGPKTVIARVDGYDAITDSPQALATAARLPLDVYSLARMISSENGREPAPYLLALAESTRNYARAQGVSVTRLLTRSKFPRVDGLYSEQAAGKWASTRLDPTGRHVAAARAALDERTEIFAGAIDFFDPRSQDAGYQNNRKLRLSSEQYIDRAASEGKVWIGPVEGLNPYRLMLFRRVGGRPSTAGAIAALAAGRTGSDLEAVALGGATVAGASLLALAFLWGL